MLSSCIAAGTPYMDVCDDMAHSVLTRTLHERAKAAGVPCITTAGIYPGVSNVMAAHMISKARKEYDDDLNYRVPEPGASPQRQLSRCCHKLKHAILALNVLTDDTVLRSTGRPLHETSRPSVCLHKLSTQATKQAARNLTSQGRLSLRPERLKIHPPPCTHLCGTIHCACRPLQLAAARRRAWCQGQGVAGARPRGVTLLVLHSRGVCIAGARSQALKGRRRLGS